MTIERDKKKKGWMLNFGRDGSAVKEKIINSIKEGSNEVQDCLSLRSYQLYWSNTLNSLKIFVCQFIEKGGKWSTTCTASGGEKFESNKLTIICCQQVDKKQWKLSFLGENGNEMIDKVIELETLVNGDNTPLEMLAKRLKLRNFVPHDVKGDRACFFRVVAQQIYGTEENHKCIRMAGINHIRRFPRNFVDLMKEPLEDYIKRMSRDEEQCDEIIIKAVASATNSIVEIFKPDNSDPHCVFYPEKPRKVVVGDVDDNQYVSVDQINKNNIRCSSLRLHRAEWTDMMENVGQKVEENAEEAQAKQKYEYGRKGGKLDPLWTHDSSQYYESIAIIDNELEKNKQVRIPIKSDGHCIVRAFFKVLTNEYCYPLESYEKLLHCACCEIEENLPFYYDNITSDTDVSGELDKYRREKNYNQDIVDLIVYALANSTSSQVSIYYVHNGVLKTHEILPTRDRQVPKRHVTLVRLGEHYEAVLNDDKFKRNIEN